MRLLELSENDISKQDVIKKVNEIPNTASGQQALNKAYYSLDRANAEGVFNKLTAYLVSKKFTEDAVISLRRAILTAKGTDESKLNFVNALTSKKEIINMDRLLSSTPKSLSSCLVKIPEVEDSYVAEVFRKLAVYTPTGKGPCEYAIACLVPGAIIEGKGDVKYGNDIVELKAGNTPGSALRLGETGMLKSEVAFSYLKEVLPAKHAIPATVNAEELVNLFTIIRDTLPKNNNINKVIETFFNKMYQNNQLGASMVDPVLQAMGPASSSEDTTEINTEINTEDNPEYNSEDSTDMAKNVITPGMSKTAAVDEAKRPGKPKAPRPASPYAEMNKMHLNNSFRIYQTHQSKDGSSKFSKLLIINVPLDRSVCVTNTAELYKNVNPGTIYYRSSRSQEVTPQMRLAAIT